MRWGFDSGVHFVHSYLFNKSYLVNVLERLRLAIFFVIITARKCRMLVETNKLHYILEDIKSQTPLESEG
jgi:hypothetical protein